MPSTTPKMRRTMAAAAHNAMFARKLGIQQDVAQEFNEADQAEASKNKLLDRTKRTGNRK